MAFAVKGDVRIEGADALKSLLKELPQKFTEKELVRVLKQAAKPMVKDAKSRAPVGETGMLKKHIKVMKDKKKFARGNAQILFGVTKKAPHAHLVEFGTIGHFTLIKSKQVLSDGSTTFGIVNLHPGTPPRPFLRPAFDKNKDEFVATVGEEAFKIIKKAVALKRGILK